MDIMAVYVAIKPFLPLAAALVLWALKKFSPLWIGGLPAEYKVAVAAIVGAIISFLADYSGGITMSGVLLGAVGGLASSTVRNVAVGKPNATATPEITDMG